MTTLLGRIRAVIDRQPYHLLLPFLCVWTIKPFYQGSRFDWAGLAVALLLFCGFYVLAHATRPLATLAGLAGLTALGALYVPLNPEASGTFAFAAAIYAASNPQRSVLWSYLCGINLLLLTEAAFFHLNLWTWIGGGGGAILFTLFVLLNARERKTNLQLRLAQDEIGRLAKLAERDRITRDLHDVLGHTLSLIAMKSELAQKRFSTDVQGTLGEVQQVEVIARQALVRVREAIHGYSAASFQQEVDRISSALTSVGVRVERTPTEVPLTSMQETVFAMVLQEASTNIIRHAHASCCRIEFQATDDAVLLVVADDGQGSRRFDGFGLRGMEERLRLLGGSLQVTAHRGTVLVASLPRSYEHVTEVIPVS